MGTAWWYLSEGLLWLFGRRRPYGILRIDLKGDPAEGPTSRRLSLFGGRQRSEYLPLLAALRWARDDAAIRAVYVRCGELRLGWARVQEIRRALSAVRRSGRPVWIHLTHAGLHEYVLGSAADRVLLTPAGGLDIAGLSSEVTFVAGALEKLGVQAEVVQLGRYKSAGEMFTRTTMSPEHREMVESLVSDLYGQLVAAVAEGRGMDPAEARAILDRGPFSAKEALEANLVDALQYDDESEESLRESCEAAAVIEQGDYVTRRGKALRRPRRQQALGRLGLVHVVGSIKMGDSLPGFDGSTAAGAEALVKDLRELRDRNDVRGVVLRVTSPGGSGLASDLLWHELRRIRQRKPLVVSLGDVAASGGYYIGVAGSLLLAEQGTITGSIGVLAGKPVLRGLYGHLGVTKEVVSQGRHAALHSDYLPLGDAEREVLQRHAAAFYGDFVDKVASGRDLPRDRVDAVAQGRVWTGRQAQEIGLVDQIGGLAEAIDEAKVLAGFERGQMVAIDAYPRPSRLWKLPGALLPFQGRAGQGRSSMPDARRERIWALLPLRFRFF